jgi:dihydrofolate synthase/folylpolyglutamate synthase
MTYPEAIQFLYDLQLFGMKLGLENARRLAALAGNPQERLRFVHVAGTNGKGSTCAMLEHVYRAAGLRVGLFTSPHLVSFAERIQVNRRLIAHEEVARLVESMRELVESDEFRDARPTFFEVVTVMALRYFAAQNCDLVVWETGLGGRLDATNIVTPLASVITNIQLDHQQFLGETLPEIAREKAGIIKRGLPVITAADDAGALAVIEQTARAQQAPLTVVKPNDLDPAVWEIGLPGEHQRTNAAVALAVVRVLQQQLPVTVTALKTGVRDVQWAGRLQTVIRGNGQMVLLDAAHNPAGAETLARALPGLLPPKADSGPALILGTMRDKDYAAICRVLAPLAGKIYLTPVSSHRTVAPESLAAFCVAANPEAEVVVCADLAEAFARVDTEKFVIVTGSIHFIGEAMEFLGLAPASDERALNEYHPAAGPIRVP